MTRAPWRTLALQPDERVRNLACPSAVHCYGEPRLLDRSAERQMDRFILGRIGKAMRDQFDDVTNEPLPEHLIELIKLLIEQRQGEPPLNSLDAFIKNAAQRLLELQKDLK